MKCALSIMAIGFGMNTFAGEVINLRCEGFEKRGVMTFEIVLSEKDLLDYADQKIANASTVKVKTVYGPAFTSEAAIYSEYRTPGKSAFYIGDEAFIRLDRTETDDGTTYEALTVRDNNTYGLKKGMTSECKLK